MCYAVTLFLEVGYSACSSWPMAWLGKPRCGVRVLTQTHVLLQLEDMGNLHVFAQCPTLLGSGDIKKEFKKVVNVDFLKHFGLPIKPPRCVSPWFQPRAPMHPVSKRKGDSGRVPQRASNRLCAPWSSALSAGFVRSFCPQSTENDRKTAL